MYRNLTVYPLILISALLLPCALFAARDSRIQHAQSIIAPTRLVKNGMMQSPDGSRNSRIKNAPAVHYSKPVYVTPEERLFIDRYASLDEMMCAQKN